MNEGFNTPAQPQKKRWQKIVDLPEHAVLHDLSTGEKYKRGELRPLFKDGYHTVVNYFQHIHTGQTIYAPFLRLITDTFTCSLVRRN